MFSCPSQKHPLAHSTPVKFRVVTSHCPQRPFYRCTIQWSIGAETFCYNTDTHTHTVLRMQLVTLGERACTLLCVVTNKLRATRPRKRAASSTRPWNCFPSNSVQRWSVVHTAYHPIRTESSSPGIKQPGRESGHSPLSSTGVNPLNTELSPICHLLALLGGATIVIVSRLSVNSRWIYMSTPMYVWTARFLDR